MVFDQSSASGLQIEAPLATHFTGAFHRGRLHPHDHRPLKLHAPDLLTRAAHLLNYRFITCIRDSDSRREQHIMQENITHVEEYNTLRTEIAFAIQEVHRTEFWVCAGVGLLYGWLMKNRTPSLAPLVWYMGPAVVLAGACRCAALYAHMRRISEYIQRIEKSAFGENTNLPGWENHSARNYMRTTAFITAAALWTLMLLLTIIGSCILC